MPIGCQQGISVGLLDPTASSTHSIQDPPPPNIYVILHLCFLSQNWLTVQPPPPPAPHLYSKRGQSSSVG